MVWVNYQDERYCEHCGRDTPHTCSDTDHERDSSWDYQQCMCCRWYKYGHDCHYTEPDE